MDLEKALTDARAVGLEQVAQRCKTDLFYLCKYILASNPDLITEHTHRDVCEITKPLLPGFVVGTPVDFHPITRYISGKVDDKLSDQFDPNRNKLLVLLPRGTFKSSIITVGLTLQYVLNDGDARILIDSETYGKSKNFLAEVKGHLEGNKKYRAIYKQIHGVFPDDTRKDSSVRWTDAAVDLSSRTIKKKEPSISCSGVDRSINGMHFDLIIEDDLHSEKNVTNKDQIQQVIDHRKLANSLLDPGMPKVTIGTRWDFQDAYNDALTTQRDSYNIIVRKAIEDDGSLFFPERLTLQFLNEQKRDQGSYIYSCNPGYAPILMADWSTKRLDEVRVGDEIIGFELGSDGKKNKLVKTTVNEINSRIAMIQDIKLDSGRNIRCTPDHQWYTGRGPSRLEPHRKAYRPVEIGSSMMEVIDTDIGYKDETDNLLAYAYLAGMIDGEGAAKYGNISISQSEEQHPAICQRIRDTLEQLELPYKTGIDYTVINGGRQAKFDILRFARPVKADQIQKTLWDKPGMAIKRKSKVIAIEPYGEERVYALTTNTGNYVAWGMMSKNCQYMNNPVDDETATFKHDYFQTMDWDLVKDKPINWCIAIDPSMEGPYSDYAAFVIAGLDAEQNLYVRNIHRAKMNYAGIITLMFDWNQRYQPRRMALETIATQSNISYMLNVEQKDRGIWLPIKEIKSRSSTKEDRIRALAPYYEFRRVYHVTECNQLDELEYELTHFPKGENDDIIDALATILEIATPPSHRTRKKDNEDRDIKRTTFKPRSLVTGI